MIAQMAQRELVGHGAGDHYRPPAGQQRLDPGAIHAGPCLRVPNHRARPEHQEVPEIGVALLGDPA